MGSLAHLLKNRFYIGDVDYRGEVHRGEHEPILTRQLFEAVQAKRVPVSISIEMGPQICIQKGPHFETVGNDSARPGGAGQVCAAGARAVA